MPNVQPTPYSAEIIQKMIETMENFIDKSAEIVNKYENLPTADSRASAENNSFPDKELVEDVYSRGSLCFESAADHFMAFTDTLKPPAKTLSPYTCLRSFMESSALVLWLLDLKIDVRERVGRCFGFRYKEFTEQIKFFEADKITSKEAQVQIDRVKQRMAVVEKRAISLGYPQLTKNGKITGIATHMPEVVGLVKITLDKETEYRLLSGVAHSYLWASRQVGFQVVEGMEVKGHKLKAVEKHFHPEMFMFGVSLAIPTLARVFWTIGKQYGWDMQEIEGLLNHTFDELRFNNNLRFWRQP